MSRRNGAVIRTKKYERFRGVDFTTDPALVDDARSPWAPNMVADMGGMPEKRPGWRTLVTMEGRINGLFRAEFGGTEQLLVHAGTALYRWFDDGETAALIAENERFRRSSALEDMVAETFCRPVAAEEKRYWTTGEVVDCLKARYRSVDMQNVTRQSIGYVLGLSRFGFQRKRSAGGMVYLLAERKE